MSSRSKFLAAGLLALSVFAAACGSTATVNNSMEANVANAAKLPANTTNTAKPAATPEPAAAGFSETVELHGIKFTVTSPNSSSGNFVTVKPAGLQAVNEEMKKDVNGTVTGAEVGDLDIDGSPEVYIYVRENSAEKRASLVAYAANKKKSLSEIAIPEIDPKSKEFTGYNGEDEFAVVESRLARRFPIFEGTGASAKKTGKMRQLQYKLKQGEATWQLAIDKTTEF